MTNIWGATYWNFFHTISTMYPDKPSDLDKNMASTFMSKIDKILPCKKCAKHYQQNFRSFKIRNALNSKNDFIEWFVDFHNYVNMALNKKMLDKFKMINKIKKNSIDNPENNNIISQLCDVMEFMIHAFPEKENIRIGYIYSIRYFLISVIHLAKLKKYGSFNLHFNDKKSFIEMKNNFIQQITTKI